MAQQRRTGLDDEIVGFLQQLATPAPRPAPSVPRPSASDLDSEIQGFLSTLTPPSAPARRAPRFSLKSDPVHVSAAAQRVDPDAFDTIMRDARSGGGRAAGQRLLELANREADAAPSASLDDEITGFLSTLGPKPRTGLSYAEMADKLRAPAPVTQTAAIDQPVRPRTPPTPQPVFPGPQPSDALVAAASQPRPTFMWPMPSHDEHNDPSTNAALEVVRRARTTPARGTNPFIPDALERPPAPAPAPKPTVAGEAAKGLVGGLVGGPAEALAATGEALGLLDPAVRENVQATNRTLEPAVTADVFENPAGTLGDPLWWAHTGGQVTGSVLSLMGAGGAGVKLATGAGKALKLAPAAAARLVKIGGPAAATLAETWLESFSAYATVRERGGTEDAAAAAAAKVAAVNLPLLGATNLPLFNPQTKSRLLNAVFGGVLEGPLQEAPQQMATNVAVGDPLMQGVGTSAVVGSLAGTAFGGLQRPSTPVTPREPQPVPGPTTPAPPVAARPGASESVGPVAPSPEPSPVAPAAVPTASPSELIGQAVPKDGDTQTVNGVTYIFEGRAGQWVRGGAPTITETTAPDRNAEIAAYAAQNGAARAAKRYGMSESDVLALSAPAPTLDQEIEETIAQVAGPEFAATPAPELTPVPELGPDALAGPPRPDAPIAGRTAEEEALYEASKAERARMAANFKQDSPAAQENRAAAEARAQAVAPPTLDEEINQTLQALGGDVLPTGETQPRLPGDVGAVREQEVPTPKEEAPFSLQPEVGERTEVQPTLQTWQDRTISAPTAADVPSDRTSTQRTFSKGYDKPNLHERRELGVMLKEMDNIEYTDRSLVKFETSRPDEWVAGAAGAPVFDDIQGSTREAVAKAIRRVLAGKKATAIGERAIDVARQRLNESGHVSARRFEPDAGDEPGRTYVERTHDMTPEEATHEKAFREAVENKTDRLVAEYRKRFGNVVDADKFKELYKPYAESDATRESLNRAIHKASSAGKMAVYRQMVQEAPRPGQQPSVTFVAGGPGAGKSTATEIPGVKAILDAEQIVVDGPLSNVKVANSMIGAAVDAGKSVSIMYVHRDPVEAWTDGVQRRAGRKPPLDYHVGSHARGVEAIRTLHRQWGDHPNVQFDILENVTGTGVTETTLDQLPEAYNEGDVRSAIDARQSAAPAAEGAWPGGAVDAHQERDDRRDEAVRSGEPRREDAPQEVAPAAEPPREFSSTQIELPSGLASKITALAKTIPDSELGEDGREDKPHVTVKFGLHTDDVAEVRRVLVGEAPITVTLGKTSIFPAKDGADYDVVKIDIDSPDLHRLNAKIAGALDNTDTHPTYKPHATIAYVKAGLGQKYVGRTDLEGKTVTLDAITFSGKDRSVVSIPLTGTAAATPAPKPSTPVTPVAKTSSSTPVTRKAEPREKQTATELAPVPLVFDRLVTRGELPVTPRKAGRTSGGGVSAMPIHGKRPMPSSKGTTPVTAAMRPSAIIEKLRKGLGGIPVNVGRFKQRALGIYKQQPQAVRLRVANDVQTLAHELGHHLDHAVLGISRKDARWRDELQAMGQATSRPSYSAGQQRQEGAAEFLRLYLIEPQRAKDEAPEYFAEFERQLEDHPELKTLLHESRADLAGLISQDPATRGKMRIDFTGQDSEGIYQRLKNDPKGELQHLSTLWVDDLAALRAAVDEMRDAQPIDARQNAYVLARNARGTGGMAEGFLEHGVRGRNGRFLSGSLGDAITPVREHLEDFASYLTALRVLEVQALKGKETGMTAEEARAIIQQVERGPHAEPMARARDNVYTYNQALIQYAREYHAISKDQHAKLLKEVHYVPLQRVMDSISGSFSGSARKIANRTTPIKRMKGSGRDIINPLESIIRNTFAIVDMVEKNRAMQALVRQADKAAGSAKWLERVPTPDVATKFNLSQIQKDVRAELEDMGIDLPDNFDLDGMVKVFTPASFVTPGQNLVTVIRDGDRQFYEVHNQPLYDAITAIGERQAASLVEWASSKATSLLRAGATLTPGFIARNPTRDTLVAFMQSRYGFIPVYDTIRGFLSVALGDEDAKLFFTSGIQQSALVGADRDRLRKMLRDMPESSRVAFFKNIVLHPIDMLRALSENMEAATRVGEFRLALNAGGKERRSGVIGVIDRLTTRNARATDDETLARATLAARDVTTDFSRGGKLAKEVSRYKAFFNARVQGYVRMAETAGRDPVGTVLNATALALFSYFLWWANSDDDEYDEIPDWEKSAYWHIPANLLQKAGVTRKGYIKVAKPFEWAYLANVTEAALSYVRTKNPDALTRIKPETDPGDVLVALFPSILLPAAEAYFNYDSFRDTNIVKPWDVGLRPDQLKSDWTTETAIWLGKRTNIAPAKWDHVISGYGAGFARGVVDYGTDPVARILNASPSKNEPAKKWQRVPVAGTFYREGSYDGGSQSLRLFYEEYEKVVNARKSLTRYGKTDPKGGTAFLEESKGERWRERGAQILAAKETLDGYGDIVDEIYKAPPTVATPAQKREALDRVYERMIRTARWALGKPDLRGGTPITPSQTGVR